MKRVDRYIMLHIFGLTAMVAMALLAIHTFISFVAEIDEAGQGGFGYAALLSYTLWLTPNGLYVLMPIIAMLGTLMGLGVLAAQGELTAMRAAGVSLLRIGGATLAAGTVLGVLCFVIGDWLAPYGEQTAEALRSESRSGIASGVGGKPVWLREGEHVFRIQRLVAEDHIEAVEIYSLGPQLNLQAATTVQDGRYRDGHWIFTGVRRTEFGPESARVVELPEMQWGPELSPEVLRLFVLQAKALSSDGLVRLIRYLHANNLDAASYTLALCRKLVAPFTVMAMMLFAIPFVLGPLRNTGAGQRLLVGILIGVGFYVVNEVTVNTGELYRWNPLISTASPTLALVLLGLWRLRQAR